MITAAHESRISACHSHAKPGFDTEHRHTAQWTALETLNEGTRGKGAYRSGVPFGENNFVCHFYAGTSSSAIYTSTAGLGGIEIRVMTGGARMIASVRENKVSRRRVT